MTKPSPLLYSIEGANHFDNDKTVPSHFVATVIRGAVCEESRLKAVISHLEEIVEMFILDAQEARND